MRSCWDYHLRVDEFRQWLDRLQQNNITLLNSPDLIRWNIDKRYLRELANRGIPIPDTVWLAAGEQIDLADACRVRSWPNAIAKPLIGASAQGLQRNRHGLIEGPLVVQEYLPEIESAGEWSLMYFAGEFSHAVRKRAAPGDFRVQSDFGGAAELAAPPAQLMNIAAAALALTPGQPLFARVDLVERHSSALLMELELIEPELFLSIAPGASRRLAVAIQKELR